ncbi:MAG: type restriction-modification system StyLTI enzyme mod [Sphingomonas bacterium]|nr:type restriction-modification system StyLTI enzyme mod [Sphingomonas bacterium]
MAQDNRHNASAYKHSLDAVQRPDVGVEAQFPNKKQPRTYRYDSSLSPELSWDENAERDLGEWLINLIAESAEKGEEAVFAEPQVWLGTEERFSSLAPCAARAAVPRIGFATVITRRCRATGLANAPGT